MCSHVLKDSKRLSEPNLNVVKGRSAAFNPGKSAVAEPRQLLSHATDLAILW